jgi:eukaryotic-like serine/threonine-protein kinase
MPQVAPLRPDDPKRVGRYRLTGRFIGIPGDSPEYLGRGTDGDRVTVTLLPADRTPDSAARDRFTAEARAARRVAPFCAARILDAGLDNGRAFLVSEHVAGPLLSEFIAADGPRRGPELEALAIGIATGLTVIHQAGLVHGDFGPDYVALGTEGPRVVGFGITPPYGVATPSADMLAWAHAVLYAASGRPVADPQDLALLAEPLRSTVAQCAAPDPAARPAARQVVLRLLGEDNPPVGVLAEGARRAARAGVRTAAEQPDSPSLAATRPQRAKAIGWAAAAIVCVVAIIVAVHVLAGSDQGAAVQPASVSQPDSSNPSPPAGRSASPTPSVTIPSAVGGTWSGSVSQGAGGINAQLILTANSRSGKITYSGGPVTCSGILALTAAHGQVLVLHQEIDAGKCNSGVITLTEEADDTLKFRFNDKTDVTLTGTLTKS